MSTREGFFRAWAVGTAVWLVAVIFFAVQDVSGDVAVSKWIYVPRDPQMYLSYIPRPQIDDGRVVRMPDGSELYFHRSIQHYWDDQNIDAIVEDFWARRWIRYWDYIRPWLLLIALPGFLFILVYAALWVKDGFGAAA